VGDGLHDSSTPALTSWRGPNWTTRSSQEDKPSRSEAIRAPYRAGGLAGEIKIARPFPEAPTREARQRGPVGRQKALLNRAGGTLGHNVPTSLAGGPRPDVAWSRVDANRPLKCYTRYGVGVSHRAKMCPRRAPARQRPGSRCRHNQWKTLQLRAYLGLPKLGP
jgi:hypothetical protein